MSKTRLQRMTEAAERILSEYRGAVEPLLDNVMRREIAGRLARELKTIAEDGAGRGSRVAGRDRPAHLEPPATLAIPPAPPRSFRARATARGDQ